jgi:hypothetical protein
MGHGEQPHYWIVELAAPVSDRTGRVTRLTVKVFSLAGAVSIWRRKFSIWKRRFLI